MFACKAYVVEIPMVDIYPCSQTVLSNVVKNISWIPGLFMIPIHMR